MRVVVLAGGFGGARMAHGFALEAERRRAADADPLEVTVVGNTADDLEIHGLHVSPDLDTVMYTLAGLANTDTGWGVRDETWSASAMLDRYGEPTWFSLGDRDLATHIVRTARLRSGQRLTTVTLALCSALGVQPQLLPVTDDRLRTRIRTADGWLDFQDYFVRRHHADEVVEVRFEGAAEAQATPEVVAAIRAADMVAIAPSNPVVSVAPLLAVADVLETLRDGSAPVVAVSPIVGGSALRGPAAGMLRAEGFEASAAGVAAFYADRFPGLVDTLALDGIDEAEAGPVREAGIEPLITQTVMRDDGDRRQLARALLRTADGGARNIQA
jgi:LPPG:FO 2-phospho-L-lactate transferase